MIEAVNDKRDTSSSQQSVKTARVLVAASSSGGHLIPALHIMKAIKEAQPGSVVEAIGTGRPLEEKILVENGFTRHVIEAVAIKQRGFLGPVRFILSLPRGVAACVRLFRSFKPDAVVGVGGYVSVLPVVVARCMRIPTWIHEAELQPGLANKFLAYWADRISISFTDTKVRGRARSVCTGHPVRPELKSVARMTVQPGSPKHLLVLGGSQGARGLDEMIPVIGPMLKERGIEVVHQCREENMELVRNSYRACGVAASVVPFIDDMAGAYEWSDVIISRAGASSVAEIACVNRPVIFVPYPFQQGTHQSDNARSLAQAGKAVVIEENQPEFGPRLLKALEGLLTPEGFKSMKMAPYEPRGLGAAQAIAEGVLTLVSDSGTT
jgi:UDP-N-acetylglucosamine--N-acetylmuramyl-(pentapeptide) pyrophosphoryl-undecaprenol N-acetylglucosamine transferase